MAPLISHIYELGFMQAVAIPQTECFQGGRFQLLTSFSDKEMLENCMKNYLKNERKKRDLAY